MIAAVGLAENSSVVLVASMLISPLMVVLSFTLTQQFSHYMLLYCPQHVLAVAFMYSNLAASINVIVVTFSLLLISRNCCLIVLFIVRMFIRISCIC